MSLRVLPRLSQQDWFRSRSFQLDTSVYYTRGVAATFFFDFS